MSEHQEQCLIFEWAKLSEPKYPMLKYMYSTLNGIRLSIGSAVKAKRSGNKSGVPDMVLPYDNGEFNGLYIELKVDGNKPSKEQEEWIKFLTCNNYKAEVVYGATEAIDVIREYIK